MSSEYLNVLNRVSSAEEVAVSLQKLMNKLKGEYMTEAGQAINYTALRESDSFQRYLLVTQQLREVNLATLSEEENKAFFINVYNALTIHGIAASDTIPQSVLEIDKFWETTAYNVGGFNLSLDDIEHGILRGNAPHPSRSQPQFDSKDPRLQFSLRNCDPRIHFALVCGAKSCPAVSVYTTENLERALSTAAESFCQQEVQVDISKKQVTMSKIFQWYMTDFAPSPKELVRWVLQYLNRDQVEAASLLLSDPDLQVNFSSYNWQLNKL